MRWWVVVVLGAVAGCGPSRGPEPGAPPAMRGDVEQGVASWYGPGFHGRRTANGEVYDQEELTAAHQSLPHGTRVMVTNLDNGRAVEVRINDRGPFVGGRVIDLSKGAARSLGMLGPGLANVRLEILDRGVSTRLARRPAAPARARRPAEHPVRPSPLAPASPPEPVGTQAVAATAPAAPPEAGEYPPALPPAGIEVGSARYTVQVATLTDSIRANHLCDRLRQRFPEARVNTLTTPARRYYQVEIGPYPVRTVALARAELVTRLGWPAVITHAE